MRIEILCSEEQWKAAQSFSNVSDWIRVDSMESFSDQANAIFILEQTDQMIARLPKTAVFYNDPIGPSIKHPTGHPLHRFCGWPGLFEAPIWEVVGEINEELYKVLKACGKKIIRMEDKPGLVAPRVISMIINEAFFALEDGISTREEIDTAMKLGTNYPFGPFEWCEKIGVKNVFTLLNTLYQSDERYKPSRRMIQETEQP